MDLLETIFFSLKQNHSETDRVYFLLFLMYFLIKIKNKIYYFWNKVVYNNKFEIEYWYLQKKSEQIRHI